MAGHLWHAYFSRPMTGTAYLYTGYLACTALGQSLFFSLSSFLFSFSILAIMGLVWNCRLPCADQSFCYFFYLGFGKRSTTLSRNAQTSWPPRLSCRHDHGSCLGHPVLGMALPVYLWPSSPFSPESDRKSGHLGRVLDNFSDGDGRSVLIDESISGGAAWR